MKPLINPFLTIGYQGPNYFCDREEETILLTNLLQGGLHVSLFAIRRLGKTGLIHHIFNSFTENDKLICVYLDILSTKNLMDFINVCANAINKKFPQKKILSNKINTLFKSFKPTITFDVFTGVPSISLSIETRLQQEKTIEQIFNFLDNQGVKVIFAIDEFQQILEYPETNTEAILRTFIQQLKNTTFIFSGSNQKMMHEIFNSAKRPFFASTSPMNLGYIDELKYKEFIIKMFDKYNRTIDEDCISFVLKFTNLHTFYVQYFCFTLFAKNKKHTTLQDGYITAKEILKLNEGTYYQYKNLLTKAQWNLLRAFAIEGKVTMPTSKHFITKHQLGTPSMVTRGMEALLEKEMILHQLSAPEPYYEVYDKFLKQWLVNF